jgi:hypothetical protein
MSPCSLPKVAERSLHRAKLWPLTSAELLREMRCLVFVGELGLSMCLLLVVRVRCGRPYFSLNRPIICLSPHGSADCTGAPA